MTSQILKLLLSNGSKAYGYLLLYSEDQFVYLNTEESSVENTSNASVWDPHFTHNLSSNQMNFFHQYLHQHAQMSQWMMQIHKGINHRISDSATEDNHFAQYAEKSRLPARNHRVLYESTQVYSESSTVFHSSSSNTSDDTEDSSDDDKSESESESESEFEIEFDPSAILAMRAAKEDLKRKLSEDSDSSSFEKIEPGLTKEDFEYVELGSLKTLKSDKTRLIESIAVNQREKEQTEKEIMCMWYGDKSATIAGLETAMSLNFERLCDTYQPPVWPVLPVRL